MGVIFPCINGPIDTEQAECEQAGVPGGRGGTRPIFAYRRAAEGLKP